jgi:hypothetical protein
VFAWHLWLVSRRQERGNLGIELVAGGVLALTAPAAYWISAGVDNLQPWILWGFTWLQSAASIVYVYLRLKQRRWSEVPLSVQRWKAGGRTLAYHVFNVLVALVLVLLKLAPPGAALAFGLMLLDALEGVVRPAVGARPAAIGIRQLLASSVFVILMAISYGSW